MYILGSTIWYINLTLGGAGERAHFHCHLSILNYKTEFGSMLIIICAVIVKDVLIATQYCIKSVVLVINR